METLCMSLVPDLLTIEEAARVLRIGRTKAYAMGQEWRVTDGQSGIKVSEFGGQLRVPRVWIEEQLGAPLRSIPQRPGHGKPKTGADDSPPAEPTPAEPTPEAKAPDLELLPGTSPIRPTPTAAKPSRTRRRTKARKNADQLTLPFD
ncbi:MAG: hypothetical protein ACI81L_002303 [Verrucomicrobiales bacterium]|jgi:hypothetical protein